MRRPDGDDFLASCFLGVFRGSDLGTEDSDIFVPGMGRRRIVQYS